MTIFSSDKLWVVINGIKARQMGSVLAMRLDPNGIDCEIPHWLEGGTKHLFKGAELSLLNAF